MLNRCLIAAFFTLSSIGCQQHAVSLNSRRPVQKIDAVAWLDSEDVVQSAFARQKALAQLIKRIDQTKVHKEFQTRVRQIAGSARRLIVLRFLTIGEGFGEGKFGFGDGSPMDISPTDEAIHLGSDQVIIFEDDSGWGYLTNAPDVLQGDVRLGLSKTISGQVAGFFQEPKLRAQCEQLFKACFAGIDRQGADPHSVAILPPVLSWDGAFVVVVTAVDESGSASVAAINPDLDDRETISVSLKAGTALVKRIWRAMNESDN